MVAQSIMEQQAVTPDNQISPQTEQQFSTGVIRKDLKIYSAGSTDDKQTLYWIIFDTVADKYYKISGKEYSIISNLDKNYSFEDLKKKLFRINVDITEDGLKKIISFLESKNLLMPEYGKTEKRISDVKVAIRKALPSKILNSYLFLKIPIFNPDRFLTRTCDLVYSIFNKWIIIILTVLSVAGYITIISNWSLFSNALVNSFNFEGFIRYGLAIILLKLVHESAHAYTAKRAGTRVRQFGINFIFFLPRIYTDLTDTWKLSNNKQRLVIDSAGIVSEIFVGGLFALIWINTGPGVLKNIAYYIFTVSIINTIFVNGNPFIRYDGYYILMDLFKIDNLHKKGASVVKNLFRKYFFGINQKEQYSYKGFKKLFLVGFSISSFIYKFFLYSGIILTVYFKFTKVLGIILVILEVYVLLFRPLYNEVKAVMTMKKQMQKKNVYITSISILIIVAILFAPLPWVISIPFEVRSEYSKIIYSQNTGFIKEFPAKNYSEVKKGELLMLQKNQLLNFDVKDSENELKILETELDQISSNYEMLGAINVKLNQIKNMKEDVVENKRKREQLKTISSLNGTFVLFNEDDYKPGRWLNKGEAVGGVFNEKTKIIYAYITSKDLGEINFDDTVAIYLNDSIASATGKIISVNRFPVKVSEPSPLLSVSGGPLEVLKKVDESKHYYYLKQPYYILKIKPNDNSIPLGRTGNIEIRKFSSIGFDFIRKIIHVLQKEMSF